MNLREAGGFATTDLTSVGFRQFGSELHEFRHHEILKAAGAMADHIPRGHRNARRDDDDRLQCGAQHRIGHANDDRLIDAFKLEQDVFDFLGTDLLTAGLDDVVLPSDEIEETVGIGVK